MFVKHKQKIAIKYYLAKKHDERVLEKTIIYKILNSSIRLLIIDY